MKFKNTVFFLILILAIAVRFAFLSDVPPSLNWDEISHGYNAYSILKTGEDEWGVTLPAIFRAYGDYKLPVYIYTTVLSEFLFGLNAFAIRLPSLTAGVFTVLFTYLLAKKLFNRKVAIFSSLLAAIEPWGFFLSRGAFEANLALTFIVSGSYFFLRGLEKAKHLVISAILFGLSLWTYNSARIFVPLFVLILAVIYKGRLIIPAKKHKKNFVFCILIFAFFLVPMFYQLISPAGQARYGKVSILDEGAINKILDLRFKINAPWSIPRLISNKVTYFAAVFTKNYFSHFSPEFMFFKGGTNYQFSFPNRGLIYFLNLPFFVLGLIYLIKNYKNKSCRLILIWLLLSPIASSLTREAPHVLRSIVMLPMPMVATALGFSWVIKNKWITAGYILALFLFLENYLTAYFTDYRINYSWSWQYGYKEAVAFSKRNYEKYDKIIVTKKYGEPHEFFLYYLAWDPLKYRNDSNLIRFNKSDWYWVDRFDKFYFVNDWQVKKMVLESGGDVGCKTRPPDGQVSDIRCLLITSPGNYPPGWDKLETINFLNGNAAFEIYKN